LSAYILSNFSEVAIYLPVQFLFAGTLYVTNKHTCFAAPSDDISFTIAHKSTTEAKKIFTKGKKPGTGELNGKVLIIFFGERVQAAIVLDVMLSAHHQ
jgi:hypothetical protein